MFKKEKSNEILKGRELLRVNSLHKCISAKKRNIVIAIITSVYLIGLVFSKIVNPDRFDLTMGLSLILTLLYGTSILLVFLFGSTMGKPLIITEKGIAYYPAVVEKWDDVENYSWETFKGISRVPGPTLFSTCEGVCLRVVNKGMIQRNIDLRSGHSLFATYLILFSPDQIVAADTIFKQHGITKKELHKS